MTKIENLISDLKKARTISVDYYEDDMDNFEQQVFDKLTEVNDMCLEKGVSYNVCTTMGCEDWLQNSHYLGHEWYTDDGVCLKSEW